MIRIIRQRMKWSPRMGENRNAHRFWWENQEERALRRPRRRWNINMDPREIG
jgi:hypothetical protein